MTSSSHARPGSLMRFFQDLSEGARRQGNVLFALIFREIKTRTGQDGHGLLSLAGVVAEPVIATMVVTAFYYLLRRQEVQGVSIILFLAISVTAFTVVRRSIASVPKSVHTNRAFYAFPNVKPFDAIFASFILETLLTIMGGAILLFLIWWFLGYKISMDWFIHGFGIFSMLLVFSFGLSLIIGVYGTRFPVINKAVQMFSRGLIFLSAVMHPVNELPTQAQYYIALNPLAHAMELIRQYTLGMTPFQDVSFYYWSAWVSATIFLGFLSYYVNRYKVIER